MATVMNMPKLGFNMEEGTIIQWLFAEGDIVTEGRPIVEIQSDKTSIEVEAPTSGTLLKIIGQCDETYPCGAPICVIGEPGEDISGL